MTNFLINLGLFILVVAAIAFWIALPWQGAIVLVVLFALWMAFTRSGRRAASVASVGISTLGQRLGSSAVIVVGIAGVVGVLVALLAMGEGYGETLRNTGSADTAIVMRGSSAAEVMSVLDHDSVTLIPQAAGIAKDAKVSPSLHPRSLWRQTFRSRAAPRTTKAACNCVASASRRGPYVPT